MDDDLETSTSPTFPITNGNNNPFRVIFSSNPNGRPLVFSLLMTAAGAALGPFLDSYHSAFGVLQYHDEPSPITATLWGIDANHPALITAWWVPPLFGLAGFLIGWLYILLDTMMTAALSSSSSSSSENHNNNALLPTPPKILVGISLFTFQYWLLGILYQSGLVDRTTILYIMSLVATAGFLLLDGTLTGFVVSTATAVGGPLIEVGLLTLSATTITSSLFAGYHYTDPGETGFFPLWIVPVYFLGGPAVGNLARGIWNGLEQR